MMNLFIKRGIIAGVCNLVIGLVIMQFSNIALPKIASEYRNTAMFRPFTDPLMMIYFAYPFIFVFVALYLWGLIHKQLKGEKPAERAFEFAKVYFIIATIPGMFITYTSFQISAMMIILWTITGFLEAYVAGLVFEKMKYS